LEGTIQQLNPSLELGFPKGLEPQNYYWGTKLLLGLLKIGGGLF